MARRTSLLVALVLSVAACSHGGSAADAGDERDGATSPDTRSDADRADGGDARDADDTGETDGSSPDLTWLKHDDGAPRGVLQYEETPDEYIEYVRFEVRAPVDIHALKAAFGVPDEGGEATLYIWDDFGGNGFNFDTEEPLARATVELDPETDEGWTDVRFDEPVSLDPGRLFYAGIVVDGEDAVQLAVDDSSAETRWPVGPSIVWHSNKPPDERGFPQIGTAPGDFLLRAGIVRTSEVDADDHHFDAVPVEEAGLANVRRAALADVDGDGDLDVMRNGSNLYLNDGDAHFEDVSDEWLPDDASGNGGVFGDFDNDGDPDFFVTGKRDRLLENRGDHFVDVTDEAGIDDTQTYDCGDGAQRQHAPTEAAAWIDIDGDGWLDLYQANYHCGGTQSYSGDRLWRNRGDGTFERVDLPGGIGTAGEGARAGRGVAPADAEGDGDVDLFVTNYRLHENFFFENRGGSLVDVGSTSGLAGRGTPQGDTYRYAHSIGAAWGDVNADGALDVFVANLAHPRLIEVSQKSTLHINEYPSTDRVTFDDATEEAGIRYQETPSNPNLWDYDNDGDLDLFVTCIYDNRRSLFYRNDGHPDWTEVSYETGLSVRNGWGSVVGDLNGDGALDLLVRNKLFLNRNPSGRNAVFVRPVGNGEGATNRSGFGARVRTEVDGQTIVREAYGGHGTGVQDSPWLHVGLGEEDSTDLEVDFPGSEEPVAVSDASAGERIVVHEDGTVER